MKTRISAISVLFALAVIGFSLAGCGKSDSSGHSGAKQDSDSNRSTTALIQPLLDEWQQGDKSTAISRFVQSDWSTSPLFPASSPLSLSEEQFTRLPASDREAKSGEIASQTRVLKELAAAVAQAGIDAVAKQDTAQARKHFTSLKQCGEALNGPGSLAMTKLVGQGIKKRADAELSKMGQ